MQKPVATRFNGKELGEMIEAVEGAIKLDPSKQADLQELLDSLYSALNGTSKLYHVVFVEE